MENNLLVTNTFKEWSNVKLFLLTLSNLPENVRQDYSRRLMDSINESDNFKIIVNEINNSMTEQDCERLRDIIIKTQNIFINIWNCAKKLYNNAFNTFEKIKKSYISLDENIVNVEKYLKRVKNRQILYVQLKKKGKIKNKRKGGK